MAFPTPPLARLPIFQLPLVLFPGVSLPLHIFEPRYRQMLADCLSGERSFGLLYRPEGSAETDAAPGDVGCVARIETARMLPDGRSNILVTGGDRFAFVAWIDAGRPYHVASTTPFLDDEDPEAELDALAAELRTLFARAARAARALASDPEPVPALPDDPRLLSFAVAAFIDLSADARQSLLASRSPTERVRMLRTLLDRAVSPIESRAAMHRQARGNGTGPRS